MNDIYPDKPQKDIQMVKNLNEALQHVLENLDEPITAEHIKQVNKAVMFSLHRHAGKYKITQNRIQGNPDFKVASPSQVPGLVDEFCEYLRKIKSPADCLDKLGYIHNQLQYIHAFADGNSRTTRMILNWIMMKYRLPIIVVKMGCFNEYMGLTKLSRVRNDNLLTFLFWRVMLHESHHRKNL